MSKIKYHSTKLTNYLLEKLKNDNDIQLIGTPKERIGINHLFYIKGLILMI